MGADSIDIHNKTYSYYNDGSIKEADNNVDANFTQAYEYDFASRLRKNDVDDPSSSTEPSPYKQTLGYDAFNNITSRATIIDGETQRNYTAGFTNHRKTSGGYGANSTDWHDAAGNVTANLASSTPLDSRTWKFDAAGRMTDWLETSKYAGNTHHQQGEELTFDGDGRVAKRLNKRRIHANPPNSFVETPEYCIYSSVTGQKITELKDEGEWNKTNVYLNGTQIAENSSGFGLRFKHTEPIAGSVNQTDVDGEIIANDVGRVEQESLGGVIPTTEPEIEEPYSYHQGGSVLNPEYGCVNPDTREPMPCSAAAALQNYLGRLEFTLGQIRKLNNPPPDPPADPDPRSRWTVQVGNAVGSSRYDGWKWQMFPDDFVFADNQRNDHPGLEWKYLGLVDDRQQWGWEPAFPQDFFSIDHDGLREGIIEFFKTYGQRFRRCVWQVFATDSGGNKSNVADVMPTPSSKNFPYSSVKLYDVLEGAQGVFHSNGQIGLRKSYGPVDMLDGSTVSAKESFFRNVAHEYANYLSWFHTGDARSFGTRDGIPGDATPGNQLPSAHTDWDTGARMEKCIWGNVSY